MLCGLLVEYLTLSDWVWEFPGTHRAAFKVVSAPLWMTLLSMYTLLTFVSLLTAGIVSKLFPSLVTPLFLTLLDKVAPEDAFCPTPSSETLLPTATPKAAMSFSMQRSSINEPSLRAQ